MFQWTCGLKLKASKQNTSGLTGFHWAIQLTHFFIPAARPIWYLSRKHSQWSTNVLVKDIQTDSIVTLCKLLWYTWNTCMLRFCSALLMIMKADRWAWTNVHGSSTWLLRSCLTSLHLFYIFKSVIFCFILLSVLVVLKSRIVLFSCRHLVCCHIV